MDRELTNYEWWYIESRCQYTSHGSRCSLERRLEVVPGGAITYIKTPNSMTPVRESKLEQYCYYHRMKKEGRFDDAVKKGFSYRVFKTGYKPPV
jgi:hypothetical protein